MITIHNLSKEKPSRAYDFKVDRTTPLGNPYIIRSESQRDIVCDRYIKNLEKNISMEALKPLILAYRQWGKLRLFCWCSPKRCHAETIKKLLEAYKEDPDETDSDGLNLGV